MERELKESQERLEEQRKNEDSKVDQGTNTKRLEVNAKVPSAIKKDSSIKLPLYSYMTVVGNANTQDDPSKMDYNELRRL